MIFQDYQQATNVKKRSSVDARNIISIYANNIAMSDVSQLLKAKMKRKIINFYPHKQRFMSNKSLIGIKQNNKEMTRKINMTRNEKFRRTTDLRSSVKNGDKRPQTTQCGNNNRRIKKTENMIRPSTQEGFLSHNNTQPISIFDQRHMSSSYYVG